MGSNRVVNPAIQISQENGTGRAGGYYKADRWSLHSVSSTRPPLLAYLRGAFRKAARQFISVFWR